MEQRALEVLSQLQLPLFQHRSVQAKMEKFHMHLATLEVTRCSTWSEAFPGLHLHPGSTECARCGRDKHTPRLYSNGNNMDPGPISAQLQVIIKLTYTIHVHTHVSVKPTVEHLYSYRHNSAQKNHLFAGFDPSGDVDFSSSAHHVTLPSTTWAVQLQSACHQSAAGYCLICH